MFKTGPGSLSLLALVTVSCGGGGSSGSPEGGPPPTPDVIRTYAVTDSALYSIVLKGSALDQKTMDLSYTSTITDAAQVGDTMYASTFSRLLRIDLNAKTISQLEAAKIRFELLGESLSRAE